MLIMICLCDSSHALCGFWLMKEFKQPCFIKDADVLVALEFNDAFFVQF